MFGMKTAQPKRVVSAKELRALVRDEILLACDFRRLAGRPRHGVLGTERVQMSLEVAARIVGIVIDGLAAEGATLESSLDALYTVGGRRIFAQQTVHKLSQMRRGVVSAVPAEAFLLSLGDIIKVGKGPKVDGRRAEMQYVRTLGATSIELTAAWNVERKRKAEVDERHSRDGDLYAAVLPTMAPGVTLEEHTAQEVARYHESQVRAETKTKSRRAA